MRAPVTAALLLAVTAATTAAQQPVVPSTPQTLRLQEAIELVADGKVARHPPGIAPKHH